jgi:hypothetical protein
MTRAWWIVAFVVVGRSANAQQSTAPGALYERPGQYAYAPDTGQLPAIQQAVDRGVHGMLPTAHRIARRRLLETNTIPSVLRVIVLDDSVGTQGDSGKAMTLPRNGTVIRWDNGHGDVCKAHETVVADTLTQFCDAGSGGSAFQYVVEDAGQRLRMIAHITSPHLGGPVDYVIEFRAVPSTP